MQRKIADLARKLENKTKEQIYELLKDQFIEIGTTTVISDYEIANAVREDIEAVKFKDRKLNIGLHIPMMCLSSEVRRLGGAFPDATEYKTRVLVLKVTE